MNREEAKSLLPIITAFAEGKEVESLSGTKWADTDNLSFESNYKYRIKPSPKYRPFKDAEECWNEMLKHKSFGWAIKQDGTKILICEVLSFGIVLHLQKGSCYDFDEANRLFTFVDGAVFGVREE